MAKTDEIRTDSERNSGELPPNAPRRARVHLDFGRPPIGGQEDSCRIIDSEHKRKGGGLIDV